MLGLAFSFFFNRRATEPEPLLLDEIGRPLLDDAGQYLIGA